MAGFIKKTTGITGLAVDPAAPQKLVRLYNLTLKQLVAMPQDYPYRRFTESLVKERLGIVQQHRSDPLKIEQTINDGQIEELVATAEKEYYLSKNLLAYRAWEPLIEEAPKSQWKWPI